MRLYDKQSLTTINKQNSNQEYYLPKVLFNGGEFSNIRLETKLAYVAILDTLLNKANYTNDGIAFLKRDNPMIKTTLAKLANKDVDNDKMDKYFNELNEAKLILINKQDLFVYNLKDYD